jgi:hypothetical protein
MSTNAEKIPRVFISSTVADLGPCREAVRESSLKSGFFPIMSEDFPASGKYPPLEACLHKVAECDLLIVIIAHRYGWVPADQSGDIRKSITWLECERAVEENKEVLGFLIDEAAIWPREQLEEYQAALEIQKQDWDPRRMEEIRRNVEALRQFKEWIRCRGIRATFTNADSVRGEVIAALNHWRLQSTERASPSEDALELETPTRALKMLLQQTSFIDIRGLQVGSGNAHRIAIDELYIPLTTQEGGRAGADGTSYGKSVALHETLANRKLTLIGDPGSGKTTFLRRIAHALCETHLNINPNAAREKLNIREEPPLPLFIRVFDLASFIDRAGTEDSRSRLSSLTAPECLVMYLERQSKDFAWGLSADYFRDGLKSGKMMLLLDGLDEAPSRDSRKAITELIENLATSYDACRCNYSSKSLRRRYNNDVIRIGSSGTSQ